MTWMSPTLRRMTLARSNPRRITLTWQGELTSSTRFDVRVIISLFWNFISQGCGGKRCGPKIIIHCPGKIIKYGFILKILHPSVSNSPFIWVEWTFIYQSPFPGSSCLWRLHRPWGWTWKGDEQVLIIKVLVLTVLSSDYEQCKYLGTGRVQCSNIDKGISTE